MGSCLRAHFKYRYYKVDEVVELAHIDKVLLEEVLEMVSIPTEVLRKVEEVFLVPFKKIFTNQTTILN